MKLDKLVEIKWKEIIDKKTIIITDECWCDRPYPNHPKGCPNTEKCNEGNVIDFFTFCKWYQEYIYFYVVYGIFDREGYRQAIGKKDNIRWWNGSLKSMLKKYLEKLHKNNDFYVFGCGSRYSSSFQKQVDSMECALINVFSTMKLNGVKLDLNPVNRVVLCNLLCSVKPLVFKNGKQTTIEGWDK